jgi:hypothetical protein
MQMALNTDRGVQTLYSYSITSDCGFAPHYQDGLCSLACCKPQIRREIGRQVLRADAAVGLPNVAQVREQRPGLVRELQIWVVGLAGRPLEKGQDYIYRSVVYAMQVTDVLDFETYFHEHAERRPVWGDPSDPRHYGDAVYDTGDPNTAKMLRCIHNSDGRGNSWHKREDLGGEYVLLSDNFVHFSADSAPLKGFEEGMGIRGRKWKHDEWVMDAFREWLASLNDGARVTDAVDVAPPAGQASCGGGSAKQSPPQGKAACGPRGKAK